MEKQTPKLPEAIAKHYNCSITPSVVIIQLKNDKTGKRSKKTMDLTNITAEQAKELAAAGKYLTKKSNAPADDVSSDVKKTSK